MHGGEFSPIWIIGYPAPPSLPIGIGSCLCEVVKVNIGEVPAMLNSQKNDQGKDQIGSPALGEVFGD